ncbi:hypothetical protein QN277_025845 [Acacia crassicarpa]|uniref:F-box domain-containing protein n=1 Tax=Acacia crassicarpa TaxID=499986 RepID=A0AAE1J8X3_9FABA|nr:hypothetical protein QN277_025845 [Acacia crassicarpa]
MESHAPYLPQEIFTNILKRLPVKSLIRFQCVCKDWKRLFKTPFFIAEHVRHSRCSVLVFNRWGYKHKRKTLCLIDHDMQVLKYEDPFSLVRRYNMIASSSGGYLICLDDKSSFLVWNLATKELLRCPKFLAFAM